MPKERMRNKWSWPKKIGLILAGLLLSILVLVLAGVLLAPDYTRIKTPANFVVNQIRYLRLDERSQVFISAWLPLDLKPGQKIPALIRTERYADQFESGWLGKVMQVYFGALDNNFENANKILTAGFAFVFVQSPGSCQSSGPRPTEYPPSEIDAIGLAIDWIAKQPWSNQRVGAYGGSYSGTTADMSCASLRAQLKAVYPEKPDFDAYTGVIKPGGLGSGEFIHTWASMIRAMDADDIVGIFESASGNPMKFWEKILLVSSVRGLKRPQGADLAVFRQALHDHRSNQNAEKLMQSMEYHDAIDEVALYRYKERIEKAQVNTYTRVGWIDAGAAEGALQKFLTFNTPQKLVLLPSGHKLNEFVDLFGTQSGLSPQEPGWTENEMFDYFSRHLKDGRGFKEPRQIIYYTYGSGTWGRTETWPLKGIEEQIWYFGANHSLSSVRPAFAEGADAYKVDFTASSGEANRWMGQMGRSVRYGDRRQEDAKLLVYTSSPLKADIEITGSPTVFLYVASTHADGAFHVYLEDMDPDGRVTYLTEGLLRAIHRKTADPKTAPYVPLGVYHSFRKADALPLVPGEVSEIPITMYPISVLIKKGHCLRMAIAGHDAALKDRYPHKGIPQLKVHRNDKFPSHISLPMRKADFLLPEHP